MRNKKNNASNPFIDECTAYLKSVGFVRAADSGTIAKFIIKSHDTYKIELSIWDIEIKHPHNRDCDRYLQVDRYISRSAFSRKTLVWGWRVDSLEDVKVVCRNSIDIVLISKDKAASNPPAERSVATEAK